MPLIYKTPGIILKKQDFAESDRILYVLTPELGKIKVISKGGRKDKIGGFGLFDSFSELLFLLDRGRNFDRCAEVSALRLFPSIASDYEAVVLASYFCEAAYVSVPFMCGDGGVYALLKRILGAIDGGAGLEMLPSGLYFIMRNAGCAPLLSSCCSCGSGEDLRFFGVPEGGLLCSSCAAGEGRRPLGDEVARLLRAVPFVRTEALGRSFSRQSFLDAEEELRAVFVYHFGVPLRAASFLGSLGRGM